MNPYILDSSLLEGFKQAVHDHDDFLINTYKNYNGKNLMNLIFSAKDWLSVSVNGLPHINLNHQNDDFRSLNVLQLIMAYDLVLQSIEQLHRVFEMEHPLKKDNSVFNEDIPDDTYFAQIRASFGAHPVDLRSANGRKSADKYFASWSSDVGGNGDYTVYHYSNNPDDDKPIPLSMSFAKIHEYTVKRYSLLSNVVSVIEEKKGSFVEKQRQRTIKRSSDIVEQLKILLEENNARICDKSGYQFEIETMIKLFTAPQDFPEREREEVAKYLTSLKLLVNELYDALQGMKFGDEDDDTDSEDNLSHYYLLHSRPSRFKTVSYDLSKVFEYLNNPYYYQSLLEYHIKRLVDAGVLPPFVSLETNKFDLQLLLLSRIASTDQGEWGIGVEGA
ncbi:hypothetical protein [Paenibacillus roseipurpureus]|uniref:Uncharacterized protein n=1 Tax=Paenibacillus roseopurpureus TaxID=2918901 RepID=A0AA96LTA5_9BACL|nr:hypothetical protein [Paenibacillus sp. MBLB1832]WNR46889.1 hypothetical protein MJB10_12615 [Paenibacillus sp. MBLB1832]